MNGATRLSWRELRDMGAITDDVPTFQQRVVVAAKDRIIESQWATMDQLRGEIAERARGLENFKRLVTERLHQEADERDFCTDFDDIMEEIGLPRRKSEFQATLNVTLTVHLDVKAENSGDVEKQITDALVAERIRDLRIEENDVTDWSVEDVDEAS